jgi:cell wall-associated NlpC family hydrolase
MTEITPDRILIESRKFLGAPFYHKGRSILGIDCLGLIIVSFKRCGIHIPSDDGNGYIPTWWKRNEDRLHNHLLKYGFDEVRNPQKGDVITFKLFGNKYPAHHCGFIISENYMIHVRGSGSSKDKVVKIDIISDSYKKRLGSYFRYKGYTQ